MKGKIFLFIGIITVADIIYKLVRCASCRSDYLGFEMSGYTYLGLQTLIALILLNGAYREMRKAKT